MTMIEIFQSHLVDIGGVNINCVVGGSGPPILMLHGYPQTLAMWHKVAPLLCDDFTIIAADLRGYGKSSKPASTPDHSTYSKRAMAADMAGLMDHFGHDYYGMLAHDRGARVAHRLALDWPDNVSSMMLLDIAPTREMYANTSDGFARAYWHWFFLIQPAPFPEAMIQADPKTYWLRKCGTGEAGLAVFSEEAMEEYLTAFANAESISASCEDYRAAATIDIDHDNQDGDRKLDCPIRVLWGQNGAIEAHFDCLALWRQRAKFVEGEALPGGHYLAEELPELVADQSLQFFRKHPPR